MKDSAKTESFEDIATLGLIRFQVRGNCLRRISRSRVSPKRRRRGAIKDGILKALTVAGKAGITVKELAASLKVKPASVSVWFSTAGKKVKGIKKQGLGRYSYAAQ